MYRLLIYQQLPLLERRNYISDSTKNMCENICNNNRLKNFEKIGNCNLLGCGKVCTLSNLEKLYLRNYFSISKITKCTMYWKIIYNGCRYTSCTFKQSTKTNDSIFQTRYGDCGIIKKICKVDYNNTSKILIFFNKLEVQDQCIVENTNVYVQHLKLCKISETNDLNVITSDDIYRPCILMKTNNKLFISSLTKATIAKYIN